MAKRTRVRNPNGAFTMWMPIPLKRALRDRCEREGHTLRYEIIQALKKHLGLNQEPPTTEARS